MLHSLPAVVTDANPLVEPDLQKYGLCVDYSVSRVAVLITVLNSVTHAQDLRNVTFFP